jgi:hypothetical protein
VVYSFGYAEQLWQFGREKTRLSAFFLSANGKGLLSWWLLLLICIDVPGTQSYRRRRRRRIRAAADTGL